MAIAGERVGAEEVRAEGGDDGRIERRRPEALAPARRAVLADDLDQAGAAHGRAVERPGERLAEGCLEHVRLDVGDAHGAPGRASRSVVATLNMPGSRRLLRLRVAASPEKMRYRGR